MQRCDDALCLNPRLPLPPPPPFPLPHLHTHSGKFIIQVLDDTHLFVKADKVDFVRERVQQFNDRNVYQAPADKDEKEAQRR